MIGAARLLKCLAARHGMVVIVVNHIVGTAQVQASYCRSALSGVGGHNTILARQPCPCPS
jgi:hypothetical protein